MRFFGIYVPRLRLRDHAWLRWTLLIFGLAAFGIAVWIGGPMTGWAPLASVFWRVIIIGVVYLFFFTIFFIRWRRRVRAARALEEALIPAEPEGDGKVLAEKMTEAMAVLRKTGGASYLYDLPWYVIIGPPGAGKTTALANSGIEFPLAQNQGVSGFGGTRYIDFWFSEEAVMIDTAGRYTSQDSDAVADKASWTALLEQLKRTRPNRPINGVILSFSVEDLMKDDATALKSHAETVRARLAEIHEALKIDFPVYVMFTKADLIAGFREYFASFSLNRRKLVWGTTFQNKDRKAITVEAVPAEFDRLVARLSDEIIDRMSEEPDGISRISIFGLPGQMALLRGHLTEFMKRIFEPTRYKTNAILRGFYFTSGTQEGTPIDQVLGAMNRGDEYGGFQPSFMSGRGKSFFIHDLLTRVIFPEQGWVSHDRKAVRRAMILRGTAIGLILFASVGTAGALGYSYWKNRSLVNTAEAETAAYHRAAQKELSREVIDDTDLRPIAPLLGRLAAMPAGYGDSEEPGFFEGLGLGQRERLNRAATATYSDALERMLRPRMVLDLERRMPGIVASGEMTDIYRALKVYLLLGGQGQSPDDTAVESWFDQIWREEYPERADVDMRDQLKRHLIAMLKLGKDRKLLVTLDQTTVEAARAALSQLPLDEQAYALIQDGIAATSLQEWSLTQVVANSGQVFKTRDGQDLASLTVPALYTYEGFWGYFFDQLAVVQDQLRKDQWVLGDLGNSDEIEIRLRRLDRDLMERYKNDFIASWNKVLNNLELASMVADKPRYAALGTAASASASPILELVKAVDDQTYLSREFDGMDDLSADQLAGLTAAPGQGGSVEGGAKDVGKALASRFQSRSSGIQRMILDATARQAKKGQTRAGGAAPEENYSFRRPIDQISEAFKGWHDLVQGDPGKRPIDTLIGNFGAIWENLRLAEHSPDQSAAALPTLLNALTQYNSQLPAPLAQIVNDADGYFRSGASDASLETMNRALTNQITFFCRDNITSSYPFSKSTRSLSMDNFARFFGPGGEMDKYFTQYLEPYVERSDGGLSYRADKEITGRFNAATLKQFERAERIRRAFFAGGGSQPQVEITVAQVDAHPTVQEALLSINDEKIQTVTGSLPQTVTWPGKGKSTLLQIMPSLDRPSALLFEGSSWTFMELLAAASSKQQMGDTLRATFTIGGRNITYDFTVNAVANPFTMPEIRDFQCPQSID
ncbi:type VI secretion system membrane subunit TssM [Paracoccus aminophilus]|uniref:Type VI secretion system protein ImpL n=1 Tax=Paracoccus aminophilus JCM 7686 TaxID=1367847 RepID=S5Y1Y6_PARAH|nr:type VI secretion system membrane subunit TssM [Paracoccus aminophilus]AGT11472.1 type VI secretion system protein ImpL [Paracoccus aminophilus JCM 7686]